MEYKNFLIKSDGSFGMFGIYQKGTGALPEFLKGRFTSVPNARLAIDRYVPKRGAKSNGKTDSTS